MDEFAIKNILITRDYWALSGLDKMLLGWRHLELESARRVNESRAVYQRPIVSWKLRSRSVGDSVSVYLADGSTRAAAIMSALQPLQPSRTFGADRAGVVTWAIQQAEAWGSMATHGLYGILEHYVANADGAAIAALAHVAFEPGAPVTDEIHVPPAMPVVTMPILRHGPPDPVGARSSGIASGVLAAA